MVVNIFSVVGLVISGVATAISVLAWKAAQKSADAAERQAVEASRSVQISQIVALHDAQLEAEESVPKVAVYLEDAYQHPVCHQPVLALECRRDDDHCQDGPADARSGRRASLFEWFGTCTVIDWYELARMPSDAAFKAETGVHVPYTIITVNHAGDEQWVPPAMQVILKFDRLPVYLSLPSSDQDRSTDRTLFLIGRDGRALGCDARFRRPRVPRYFADLMRT